MNTRITSYCQVVTFGSSDMMEDAKEKEEKEEEEEEEEEEKGGGIARDPTGIDDESFI